jgi:hypothetical protein
MGLMSEAKVWPQWRVMQEGAEQAAGDEPAGDADLEEVTDVFLSVAGFLGLLLAVGAVVVSAVAALQNL